jgi:hypothetical protein
MLPTSSRLFALVLLGATLAPSAFATQVLQQDTPALVQSSSDIVIGSVESAASHWNAKHTRIVTDVAVRVEESLKGANTPTVTLTQMGGDVDGMHLEVAGSPVFQRGQRSVFFLWRDSKGRAQVNGLAMGKFDIERDPATGRAMVRRQLDGLTLTGKTRATTTNAAKPERMALDELRAEIRDALAAPARATGK